MRALLIFLLLLAAIAQGNSQHKALTTDSDSSSSLQEALSRGTFSLHARNYFMTTINHKKLTDYYANGIGAGIQYKSQLWHGFQLNFGGFFIFNLFSSDFRKKDSLSGGNNRYEIGLFNIENPDNKSDLDRLEEIYLSYSNKKFSAIIGRLELVTPYINPQDSRMRPGVVEGIWLGYKATDKLSVNTGWLWSVSPRGTVKFFSIENSIGINPQGVKADGSRGNYHYQQHTRGIGLVQLIYKVRNDLPLKLFNQYVDNIFNTTLIQADFHPSQSISPVWGIQYHFQHKINKGGNTNPDLAYYDQKMSQVLSLRAGIQHKKHLITINYTHITKDGKFLSPREWGQEPFYTYMSRERNEGLGGVNAVALRLHSEWIKQKVSTGVAYGFYSLPDVHNYRLNKYGLPSYHHVTFDFQYQFDKGLKGLTMHIKIAGKLNAGHTYNDYKYILNKVNVTNISFIINYTLSNTKSTPTNLHSK